MICPVFLLSFRPQRWEWQLLVGVMVKVMLYPYLFRQQDMKGYGGITMHILDLGCIWKWKKQIQALANLTLSKEPPVCRVVLDTKKKRKISSPNENRTPTAQPALNKLSLFVIINCTTLKCHRRESMYVGLREHKNIKRTKYNRCQLKW